MNRKQRRNYVKQLNTPQKIKNYSVLLEQELKAKYEKKYNERLLQNIDIILFTVRYTLHFNEKTKFGQARIEDFMEDLITTIDNFRTGEFDIEDYKKQLAEDGIKFERKIEE